jgi:oligosaccharide repeat unit polymerase
MRAIKQNPFIDLPDWLYYGLILYFAIYRVGIPLYSLSYNITAYGAVPLTLLNLVYSCLLFAPLLFRISFIGILHPLIFTLLYGLAKVTFSSMGANLIAPFIVSEFRMSGSVAVQLSEPELLDLNIQARVFDILALTVFYAGYFASSNSIFRITIPRFPFGPFVTNMKMVIPVAAILSIAMIYLFFLSQGGLTAYISSWGTSRKQALEELGIYLSFLKRSFVFPLLWFITLKAEVGKNVFIIPVILLTIVSGFFLVGSRSGMLQALVPFFIVWILRYKRVPLLVPSALAVLFFATFGILGQFRSSTYDKQVDWDIITNVDLSSAIENSTEELALWGGLGTDIAIYANVPESQPYLYGAPYLGATLFFIPRTIWPDKPHGSGYYVGRNIFGLTEAGIPPTEVSEVFYNFGLLGIFVIFFLKGCLYRVVVNRILYYGFFDDIYFLIAYIIFLINFNFTALSLVNFFQMLLFLVIIKTIFGPYGSTQPVSPRPA